MDFQGVMLDLIEHADIDHYDGKKVRADLEKYRNLWQSCYVTRYNSALILRDLPGGIFNVDTLYIYAAIGRATELFKLARTWNAAQIDWLPVDEVKLSLGEFFDAEPKILQVWWN